MMQIVAWLGAACCLLAGIGMLLTKAAPEKRVQTRLFGLVLLGLAAFNVWLANQTI
jgi:Zn-dependent alcohol dehydrogenase